MRLRRPMGFERECFRASWITALLVFALSSCGGGGGGAPTIRAFVAEPSTVTKGETVVLRWQVENLGGGRLRLESSSQPGDKPSQLGEVTAQSSTAVVVKENTTFRLIAVGSGGTVSRETTVTVRDSESSAGGPEISFFRSSPTSTSSGGALVTLEWEVPGAERVVIDPPGVEVGASGTLEVNPYVTSVYTLSASDGDGTSRSTLTVQVDSTDRLIFLVAGQSNASGAGLEEDGGFPTGETEQPEEGVLLLTPGFEWVQASEPSHAGFDPDYKHSFLLRFGKEVRSATGMDVFLVPAAVGGTRLRQWEPGSDNFEEAVARSSYASEQLGVPVSAIIWYQGESDTKWDHTRRDFVENTSEVLEGLRGRLADPEVIFVQLSKRLWSEELQDDDSGLVQGHNLAYQVVREQQRLMEAGARSSEVSSDGESGVERPYYHMVVAHDLPMSDAKHLSAEAQRVLGRRIANAFLTRVGNRSDQGIGPRIEGLTFDAAANSVRIDLTMAVNSHPTYDDYFSVFIDDIERENFDIRLDAGGTTIWLDLAEPVPAEAEIQVRYMPPESTPLYTWSRNVIKAQVNGLELPLPAFGMPVEDLPMCDDSGDSCSMIPGLRAE